MRIARVSATRFESSAWGDFGEREAELPLVTAMAMYPEYRHPISTWRPTESMCVVKIETDDGLTGIGWCEDYYGATSQIVNEHFARFLVGADPREITKLWDLLYRSSISFGRKGVALYGISAVDIALWDLRGQHLQEPVYQLLGGKVRDPIPAYASHLHYLDDDRFRAEAEDYVKQGYKAMKMRFPHGPADGLSGMNKNIEVVKLLRVTVGDSVDIMADAYMGWTLEYAKRITRRLAPYGLRWVEEPLLPDDIGGFIELTRTSPVPIATGEHEYTRYGFEALIKNKALDIVQFDMGRVGGFTEARRVSTLASAAGLPVCTHAYGLPTLHFVAAEPNCLMAEYFPVPVWMRPEHSETDFFDGAPIPRGGNVTISDGPGMGYKFNFQIEDPVG